MLDALIIWFMFRNQLRTLSTDEVAVEDVTPHGPVLVKAVIVATGMLIGFLAGFDTALVAAAGAAALLVTRRVSPKKVYAAIDWDLLMLFAGLFVVVGAAERAGIDRRLFNLLAPFGLRTIAGSERDGGDSFERSQQRAGRDALHALHSESAGSAPSLAGAGDVEHAGREPHDPGFDRQPDRRGGREAPRRDDRFLGLRDGRDPGHDRDAGSRNLVAQ